MLGKIIEINENIVSVKLNDKVTNSLINSYVAFQDKKLIVGEIINLENDILYVNLVGEIKDDKFVYGITTKPSGNANIYLIDESKVSHILSQEPVIGKSVFLGYSPIYENVKIHFDLNNFFSSHFAILGGTGSGKSWGVAKIIQNIFEAGGSKIPYKASIFMFDTYGEYHNAFREIDKINPYISYKSYTTNLESNEEILKIPPYLLDVDDLAILLNATNPEQLQVLEKALKLVNIFKQEGENILKIKNDIIARAILDILLSGRPSVQVRDQIFSILAFYKTEELSLETMITQPGYNRALKHCLIIDADGKLREMELLTDFFTKFLIENKGQEEIRNNVIYSLEDLENAIDFALISEGMLKSEKVYDTNNLLKVRIHNLVTNYYKSYFEYQEYVTKEQYVNSLLMKNNRKAQIVNFNINYVDDRFAKTIVKIISKMLFDVLKNYKPRGGYPMHIVLEEAHRYVQNDGDVDLLGYNIFERISKEGRKYGILLGLISQRPSELSETSLSQSNNFLIFKMAHPKDLDYIKNLIPFMTNEISKRLQVIQPGYCYAFGPAFRLPTIVKIDKPNPTPESNNVDISSTWFVDVNTPVTNPQTPSNLNNTGQIESII